MCCNRYVRQFVLQDHCKSSQVINRITCPHVHIINTSTIKRHCTRRTKPHKNIFDVGHSKQGINPLVMFHTDTIGMVMLVIRTNYTRLEVFVRIITVRITKSMIRPQSYFRWKDTLRNQSHVDIRCTSPLRSVDIIHRTRSSVFTLEKDG